MALPVTLKDVEHAREVLAEPFERGIIKRTPLVEAEGLSAATGGRVHLKLENLQRTGAFKVRGAYNKIASMGDAERAAGVIAASAGNHAQGVALAARELDVRAVICMPEDAPISKVEATRALGAEVILEGADYNEAYEHAKQLETDRGLSFVHPYDDPAIMAGQGTIGLEIVESLPEVDVVLVSVGGGGLLSGIAAAVKGRSPETQVIGVEPEGASALHDSLAAGELVTLDKVDTIADGLATRKAGTIAFEMARALVDEIVVVDDDALARSILHLLEREKTVTEGAGAAPVAALLEGLVDVEGKTVAAVLSGGNIDVTLLEHIIDRGLIRSGRYLRIEVPLADRPGALAGLLDTIAETRANIAQISHNRRRLEIGLKQAIVHLELETRGPDHVDALLRILHEAGYDVAVE